MKQATVITSVVLIPWMLGGCALFPQAQNPTPPQTALNSPPNTPQTFPSPTIRKTPTPNTEELLIPPSNPSSEKIEQGRSDPFATIPLKPTVTINRKVTPSSSVPIPPPPSNLPTVAVTYPTTPNNPTQSIPLTPVKIPAPPPLPTVTGSGPNSPVTPGLTPTEAQAVIVSGIVALPSEPVAIILAPGEKVTRTVKQGEILGNGQVLVKAIDVSTGEGVVILEQYGIEVTKQVGDLPVEASAATPPLPTPKTPEKS